MTWLRRIERAERHGFTAEDVYDAREWATCVVGELRARLQDWSTNYLLGELSGSTLALLAADFGEAVYYGRARSAFRLMHEIEACAILLKAEEIQ